MPAARRAAEPTSLSAEEIRGAAESAFQDLIEKDPVEAYDTLLTLQGMLSSGQKHFAQLDAVEGSFGMIVTLNGDEVRPFEVDLRIRHNGAREVRESSILFDSDGDGDAETLFFAVQDGDTIIPVALPESHTPAWL